MPDYGIVQRSTLEDLANQTRRLSGSTDKMSPKKAIEILEGLTPGGVEETTYILVDESGNEIPAVLVDEEVKLTATANDIRLGTTAVTDEGVITGEKEIPSYVTTEGSKLVPAGSRFAVYLSKGKHDYTKLQAIFCPFNTSLSDSVAAEKVGINNNVYPVQSTDVEAVVVISGPDKIDFCFDNDSDRPWLIRYFTYKEVY